MKADYIHKDTKTIEDEIIKGNISHIAYFRTDGGSPILYTQEYADKQDKEIDRLNNIIKDTIVELEIIEKWLKEYNFKSYFPTLKNRIEKLKEVVGDKNERN